MSRRRRVRTSPLARRMVAAHDQPHRDPSGEFERATIVDPNSRSTAVLRRVDNLARLRGVLEDHQVTALQALRMADDAASRGLTPKNALDLTPGAGPDGFLLVIQHRIDAGRFADELWAAVPVEARLTVKRAIRGWSVERCARVMYGRTERNRKRVVARLTKAADGVNAALDALHGTAEGRIWKG